MIERRFQQTLTDREAIEQEFKDEGNEETEQKALRDKKIRTKQEKVPEKIEPPTAEQIAEAGKKIEIIYSFARASRLEEARAVASSIHRFFDLPEIQKVAADIIIWEIKANYQRCGNFASFVDIIKLPQSILEPILQSPDAQKQAKSYIGWLLPGYTNKAISVSDFFAIPRTELAQIAEEKCKKSFGYEGDWGRKIREVNECSQALQFPENIRLDLARFAVKACLEARQSGYQKAETAKSIIDTFQARTVLEDTEIQDLIKKTIVSFLKKNQLFEASHLAEKLEVSESLLTDSTVQDVALITIKEQLKKYVDTSTYLDNSVNIYRKQLKVLDQHFYPIAAEAVASALPFGAHRAHEIAEKLEIPGEFLQSSEMQKLAIDALAHELEGEQIGYIDNKYWTTIKELFALTDEMLGTPEIKKKFQSWTTRKVNKNVLYPEGMSIAREVFPVSDEELQIEQIQNPIKQKILQELRWGFLNLDIQRAYSVPESLREDNEVKAAAKQGMARWLSDEQMNGGDLQRAREEAEKIGKYCDIPLEKGVYTAIENQLLLHPPKVTRAIALAETFNVPFEFKSYLQTSLVESNWGVAAALGTGVEECSEMYRTFVSAQKRIACSRDNVEERKKAVETLSGLAQNGDQEIASEFIAIVSERGKQKQKSSDEKGFDAIQEAAFMILQRLDNPDANHAMFNLLSNESVPNSVKELTLTSLTNEGRNFLNKEARMSLRLWQSRSGDEPNWDDIKFISALDNIPSTDLRIRARNHIGKGISSFFRETNDKPGIHDWATEHAIIPPEHLLPLTAFVGNVDENNDLYQKMTSLYSIIRKENSRKEAALGGLVSLLETSSSVQVLLRDKLKTIDFGKSKDDADKLATICQSLKFINDVEKIIATRTHDEDYSDEEEVRVVKEVDQEVVDLFQQAGNLTELQELLEKFAIQKIQTVLPHQEITRERIQAVKEAWNGDLEPVFTYVGRFPSLKSYIAEMVVHMDTPEAWQAWRYDTSNEVTKEQVGQLSAEQLTHWKNNCAAELGEVLLAQSSVDKPAHIRSLLTVAIQGDRHIYNPEAGFTKNQFIQETLEGVYAESSKKPEETETIYNTALIKLLEDTEQIDLILQSSAAQKIKQTLERNFAEGASLRFNAQTSNALRELVGWLPVDLAKRLTENYRQGEEEKKPTPVEVIFEPEMRMAILSKIEEVEKKAQEILSKSDVFERYGFDKGNLKNLGPYYTKRQELKATIDLLRLSNLSNRQLAINRISESGTKRGETITSVLENLKKYFKDSPLLQDIKNIEFALREEQKFGEKRRLAMIATDNPQLVWQVGKYPLGNGSCQHYAEGSMAQSLLGYVGDGHVRAVYLLDLNTLPAQWQEVVNTQGVAEAFTKHIPAQDILSSTLARGIIKLTQDGTIFLEPTYSVVNKGDNSMDNYFNAFINLLYAEPMKVHIARGLGKTELRVPASRNPSGQYEDGAEGNAANAGMGIREGGYSISTKIINQNYVASEEEKAVIERMRSSSGQY